jgi:hypothetical protein
MAIIGIVLVVVLFVLAGAWIAVGVLARGPGSLRAAYERDVAAGLARVTPSETISDAELDHLPPPVQRYLRLAGVVGRSRIGNFRVRMRGRIPSGPHARWIPIVAEQHNFVDEPARMFYLKGSMLLVPVYGYHRYVDESATMTIKAAALVTVARAAGKEMTQGETVTLFNDMCIMAPGTLIDRRIAWEPVDPRTARATFSNAGFSVRAELSFNEAGELVNFVSDDRYQLMPDGSVRKVRWSTPVKQYRTIGDFHLVAGGEGRWHDPAGEYAYIELTIDDVAYNLRPGGDGRT